MKKKMKQKIKEKKLEEISASITRYYDSLTDEEAEENRAWGEFATAQFAEQESSDEPFDQPGDIVSDRTS
jgi:hypothetical protein